jgi:hypothetical protein
VEICRLNLSGSGQGLVEHSYGNGNELSYCDLFSYGIVLSDRMLPTFRKSMLPPSSW